jgi:hypothetical protein
LGADGRVPSSLAFGFAAHIALLRAASCRPNGALSDFQFPMTRGRTDFARRGARSICHPTQRSPSCARRLRRRNAGGEMSCPPSVDCDAVAEHLVRPFGREECALDVSLTEPAHELR